VEEAMHALLVTAHVQASSEGDRGRDAGLKYLKDEVLPQLKHVPGLLSGYWLDTKDGASLALLLFENQEAADSMANVGLPNSPPPPGTTLGRIEVREVVAHI
jgi:hypothetical protein